MKLVRVMGRFAILSVVLVSQVCTHFKTRQGVVLQLSLNTTITKIFFKKSLCPKTKKGERKSPDEGLLIYTFQIHASLF